MEHICENCIYKYEPTSVRDYYLKTLHTPCLFHWGETEFKHLYWLCTNPEVAKIDKVNDSTICKPCEDYNHNGNCTYFKTADCIDIIVNSVSVASIDPVKVGDEASLEVTITPAVITPATEETEEVTNDQDISYSYQWYKNNRKLFTKKSATLKLDTSEEAVDEYFCVVTQSITDNGDGGLKVVDVKTNSVTVTVEAVEETDDTNSDSTDTETTS